MTHPNLALTILNIMSFHDGQMDKCGEPYYTHPLRVMVRLGPDASDDERHAALLHDVLEDTPVTSIMLAEMGYSPEVIRIVELLTRDKATTHKNYLANILIADNVGAIRIKLADMYDNSNLTRAMGCPDEEVRKGLLGMIEKRYKPAIRFWVGLLDKKLIEGVISEDLEIDVLDGADYLKETANG